MSQKSDGGPAFPAPSAYGDENIGHQQLERGEYGMTLRDYFASHAPTEIPAWFGHEEPPKNFAPMPKWTDAPEEHHKLLISWLDDGCFDLPEELSWFQTAVEEFRCNQHIWNLENEAARYFQWRWHYADNMLAARNLTTAVTEAKAS